MSAFPGSLFRLAGLLAALAGPALAQERVAALPAPGVVLQSGGPARPILAWVEFCQKYERECRVDVREPETIRLSASAWRTLNEINAAVNHSVTSVTDLEHWGVVDRWDFAQDGLGDCEDYQLLKRKRLEQAGFSRRAMLMTVVLDENNEGHAVLMVRTDRGDLILDNKRDAILQWQATGYTFIKRESQADTAWVSLAPPAAVATTAAR
ncbi:MAG: transglutaminase-like cysteine peptidase [Alsobacter sp.]